MGVLFSTSREVCLDCISSCRASLAAWLNMPPYEWGGGEIPSTWKTDTAWENVLMGKCSSLVFPQTYCLFVYSDGAVVWRSTQFCEIPPATVLPQWELGLWIQLSVLLQCNKVVSGLILFLPDLKHCFLNVQLPSTFGWVFLSDHNFCSSWQTGCLFLGCSPLMSFFLQLIFSAVSNYV